MKIALWLLGCLLAVAARADDAEAGWQIGSWVVDTERTLASVQPGSLVPKDSLAKTKLYFDSVILTITGDEIAIACPADDIRPGIDEKYSYVVAGVIKQKIVMKGRLSPTKIERMIFDFESNDKFSALLKVIPGRMYWVRSDQ